MTIPEGVMVGETLTINVQCSRSVSASDQAWIRFEATGYPAKVPTITAKMYTYSSTGFTVRVPIPANSDTGAFRITPGCQGPAEEVGFTVPSSVAGPAQWIIIRPNKTYPTFISVSPTQARVGSEVTFTVSCSLPPGRAQIVIGPGDGPNIIDLESQADFIVNGSTFTVKTIVPSATPAGTYPMVVGCDGVGENYSYYPPPESYSEGLMFSVLSNTLPPGL